MVNIARFFMFKYGGALFAVRIVVQYSSSSNASDLNPFELVCSIKHSCLGGILLNIGL